MPRLIPGRIAYPSIPIPDPQGQNPKKGRPVVVISTEPEIAAGGPVTVVGITTTFDKPLAPELVKLQWGYQSQSKLRSESVAHCRWVYTVPVSALESLGGIIQSRELAEIRARAVAPLDTLGLDESSD
jgi:mRNA-degrading endonuclease toxin of MazEF toxin-antitoxin module